MVRLAVHFGAVRVDSQAADPGARVRAVGETLTLPVRLLEHVDPGTIVVTPEVGRLVDGWVALEAQQQCAVDLAHVTAYTVVGVNAGRKGLAGHWHPTSG
jgi:hypothetical protein